MDMGHGQNHLPRTITRRRGDAGKALEVLATDLTLSTGITAALEAGRLQPRDANTGGGIAEASAVGIAAADAIARTRLTRVARAEAVPTARSAAVGFDPAGPVNVTGGTVRSAAVDAGLAAILDAIAAGRTDRFLGAAEAVWDTNPSHSNWWWKGQREQERHDRAIETARKALGQQEFAAALKTGRTQSVLEAVAEAQGLAAELNSDTG